MHHDCFILRSKDHRWYAHRDTKYDLSFWWLLMTCIVYCTIVYIPKNRNKKKRERRRPSLAVCQASVFICLSTAKRNSSLFLRLFLDDDEEEERRSRRRRSQFSIQQLWLASIQHTCVVYIMWFELLFSFLCQWFFLLVGSHRR